MDGTLGIDSGSAVIAVHGSGGAGLPGAAMSGRKATKRGPLGMTAWSGWFAEMKCALPASASSAVSRAIAPYMRCFREHSLIRRCNRWVRGYYTIWKQWTEANEAIPECYETKQLQHVGRCLK